MKKKKRISQKILKDYLIKEGIVEKEPEISGVDTTFANALLSYGKFCEVFNTEVLTDTQEKVAEDVIKWITVYGDSKKFLLRWLEVQKKK